MSNNQSESHEFMVVHYAALSGFVVFYPMSLGSRNRAWTHRKKEGQGNGGMCGKVAEIRVTRFLKELTRNVCQKLEQ